VFCHDFTKWEMVVGNTKSCLIQEVPVVFRCLERFEARRDEMKRESKALSKTQAIYEQLRSKKQNVQHVNLAAWRAKWKTVCDSANADVEQVVRHIEHNTEDVALWAELQDASKGICVSLGFVPEMDTEAKELLSRVLDRGTPIVIWFREIPG